MDLISIIVPVYNVSEYLEECLNSIINQSYKNIEIIVVDDGSTDGSSEICDIYLKKDNRINVYHKLNGGLSDARNYGIDKARGSLISFVDSDDVLMPNFIEYLYNLFKQNKADISECQIQRFYGSNNGFNINSSGSSILYSGKKNIMESFLKGDINTIAPAKLYPTSYFKEIRYPLNKFHEDVHTTYKVISLAEKIAVGTSKLYIYRMRPNSITTMAFNPKHLDALYGKLEILSFLQKNYPDLVKYGKANVAHTATTLAYKLSKNSTNKDVAKTLQRNIRKYLKYMIMIKYCSTKSKILACMLSINYTITRIILNATKL